MEDYTIINTNHVADMIKLETIFSEKVWLQIFKNISKSDHYHSICACSPYFHELLLPLRVEILFPEVIKLCSSPVVLTDKWYFTLLKCRSVCKAWKQGVDTTFHQILSETNTDDTDWKLFGVASEILNTNQRRVIYQPDIYNQSEMEKCLEFFQNTHFLTRSNPFPSRSILINIRSELTIYNKFFNILQIYGHHIRHCYVELWYNSQKEMEHGVLIFLKMLGLLPNLQTLRIYNAAYRVVNAECLQHVLCANPMPTLKNLKLVVNHHVPAPLSFQLIQSNPHIKILTISKVDISNLTELVSLNLEELHILGYESSGDFLGLLSVKLKWPMKKLTILCHHVLPHVNNVFTWIKDCWAETLTELNLIIPLSVSVTEIESHLKLPSLKTLRIKMWRKSSLDFILHLSKSLESLSVYLHGTEELDDSVEKNSKIQFFSCRWNLRYSNIWDIFPRLREINFADKSVREFNVRCTYRRDSMKGSYSSYRPSSSGCIPLARTTSKKETQQDAKMKEYSFNRPKLFSHMAKLQEIFPEKIWLLIFENISESDHYQSICAGSPYFHKLLLPLRTEILFPEVIKLVTKSMVFTDESYSALLLLRTVCKTWKQGVDARIQDILKEINTDATNWKFFCHRIKNLNSNQEFIMCQPKIYNQNKLEQFLKNFHSSHFLTGSNPFPSRSIHIEISSQSEIPDKLFDILETYGHHIWHCFVLWSHNQEEMQKQVQIFCKLLGLLPNLQTLRIGNLRGKDNAEYLQNLLAANTLPKFKNLELLAEHDLAGPIFSQLIQNNPHIKRISISELDSKNHSALFITPLPNLTEFHILGFKIAGDFSQLQNVQNQWPLKKLTFNFSCYNRDVLQINHVFNWINTRWSETLTDLSIIIPTSVQVSEIESPLKLPKLKSLKIKIERHDCLDFILSLSESLVSLSVHRMTPYGGGLDMNGEIKFFCHRGKLEKSNIWSLFPKLREINYADDSWPGLTNGRYYTRDQWKHCKMEEYSFNTPKYFSDVNKLQAHFSETIWQLIFNKATDAKHYHRFCAASPYFHELLLPRRTQILFPEVIKLCYNFMVSTNKSYFTLLKCRSVCKAWKLGVDATLNQILSDTNTDATDWKVFGSPSDILNKNQEIVIYQPDIYHQWKLDKFLKLFHNSHFLTGSNPFPSRSIQIHIRSELVYKKLLELLQIYGHHIWHCYAILYYRDAEEMQDEVQMFCKLLGLLPNLQTLRIYNTTSWNENTEGLKRILATNPMPKLNNLKFLANHFLPGPVTYQLIQKNPHIKKLSITKLDIGNLSELLSVPLFSLEELHILGYECVGDFLQLLGVQSQWPLKKLTIFCHNIVPHVNTVFNWIKDCWAETLTELNIIIPASVWVSEIVTPLMLPNLTTLKIKMGCHASLDFILYLSESLVSLSVYQNGTEDCDEGLEKNSKIQFFSCRWHLGYSNIWRFFPRLREVKYADRSVSELSVRRTYRRDYWEVYGSSVGN